HGYKEGYYFLPNDGAEQDRLHIQHKILRPLLDDKLGLSPVHEATYVVDIVTCTRIWALDFAENPRSHVVRTDLSLI
ncbi:hypothetical protein BJ878DRAFT_464761, partial [Calycina marina]